MIFHDPATMLPLADPESRPLAAAAASLGHKTPEELSSLLQKRASSMILSVSGWRKVFAASGNGESDEEQISPLDSLLVGAIAIAYAEHFTKKGNKQESSPAEILLGMDSRPTGQAIADIACRILLAKKLSVRHLFISAAPELMAYSAVNGTTDGFFYISASHNPIGHNGLKFGRAGGVIDREEAAELIKLFLSVTARPGIVEELVRLESSVDSDSYRKVLENSVENKLKALDNYRSFVIMTASSTQGICGQDQVLSRIREYAEEAGLGIVIDFNGSARTLSIDEALLHEMGIKVLNLHAAPREIAHGIIPEGANLTECREALETAYRENPSFIIGYMPDNDGDRGNIVYLDEETESAVILDAQEVFALAVLSELAFIEYQDLRTEANRQPGNRGSLSPAVIDGKTAVVVNGPTSGRIDDIAACFGVEVHRAEVGEANTVNLAANLRDKGYNVRILGEGSNGGNITYPASVRDPLNTVFSLVKMMALRDDRESEGLFRIWCRESGQMDAYTEHFAFNDIIRTLPPYITTATSDPRAVLKISCTSQAALKAAYEKLFIRRWETDKESFFRDLGIAGWKEYNTEGTVSREGMGPESRTGDETGGLKIQFYDHSGTATDYIWMRGSGTEPVFRILADSRGDDRNREKLLLKWHSDLVMAADKAAQTLE